jgi:CubicO group peptidase (beta-lactamase class C family)
LELPLPLRLRFLALSISLFSAAFVSAAALTESQIKVVNTAVQKQLTSLVASKKYAGAGFALIDDGRVVLLSANGVRDKSLPPGGANSFGLDTPMPVGSVTRLLTVLAALQQAERGALDLAKPVASYLPQVKFATHLAANQIRPITVRDLLLSSSGISRGSLRDLFVPPDSALLDVLAQPIWLARPAGGFAEQSFLADALLGKVIEHVGGTDLASLLTREISGPLHLTHTRFAPMPNAARAHDEGKPLPMRIAGTPAALGLSCSLRDLATVIASLDAGSKSGDFNVLNAATVTALNRSQNKGLQYDFSAAGSGQGYVFSFSESVRKQVGLVGFLDSGLTGFEVSIRTFPQHHLSVVAISNSSSESDNFRELVKSISDTALREKAQVPPRDKQVLRAPAEQLALPAGFTSAPVQSAYATPAGLIVPDIDGNAFDFNLGGFGLRANLRPDGWYRLRYRLLGMIPLNLGFIENVLIAPVSHTDRNGAVEQLMLYSAGSEVGLMGSTITSTSIAGDAGDVWLGEYEISNPDAMSDSAKVSDIEVVREDGMLLLRATFDRFINVNFALPLSVKNAELATLSGHGPGLGEPVQRSKDGVLNFSGYKLKRIR